MNEDYRVFGQDVLATALSLSSMWLSRLSPFFSWNVTFYHLEEENKLARNYSCQNGKSFLYFLVFTNVDPLTPWLNQSFFDPTTLKVFSWEDWRA